ncbi:MAG: DUF47 family protein [Eggerthellaceae bacterium]|nr:DUF47 family protein [Eggerthellaceae bacterium]
MAKKVKFDYFDAFERQAAIACEEAEVLKEAIEHFTTAGKLEDILDKAHKIETAGDEENHAILNNIATDFVTPIDREDLIKIAQCMDSVIDDIEGVIQCFYMYDVHKMHSGVEEMAELIRKSTEALHRSMGEFRHFKKPGNLRDLLEDVNVCEEAADVLYMKITRELYTKERENTMRVMVWTKVFDLMEKTCDACEHVADTMSSVVLKNL